MFFVTAEFAKADAQLTIPSILYLPIASLIIVVFVVLPSLIIPRKEACMTIAALGAVAIPIGSVVMVGFGSLAFFSITMAPQAIAPLITRGILWSAVSLLSGAFSCYVVLRFHLKMWAK